MLSRKNSFVGIKKKIVSGIFIISLLFLIGTLLQILASFRKIETTSTQDPRDKYNPSLARLDNLKKLSGYVDSLFQAKGYDPDSLTLYVNLADSVVRMRFYHGLQNYRFSENYMANLSGKLIWTDFAAKVIPNHILNGQKAFCSQSSIVFQEIIKRKGLDVRTVELPNHFCTEVLIEGNWAFHDVSYKPNFNGERVSMEELSRNLELLEQAYLYSFRTDFFERSKQYFSQGQFSYGRVNASPAPRMIWFHRITWFLSWFGWLLIFPSYLYLKKNDLF